MNQGVAYDAARALAGRLASWIAAQVEAAGADGTVVGVSGGIDSAVVAGLCRMAVGDRALGLILPCHSAGRDVEDARAVAAATGIRTAAVALDGPYDEMLRALSDAASRLPVGEAGGAATPAQIVKLAQANLKPRLRMLTLYYFANVNNLLVVGTGNRAETYVGYATKYGDAGVDIQPIAHLLKREVRAVAAVLGIPAQVIERPPTAGLWEGQTDEGEMGMTYAELDEYLASGSGRPELRDRVERMHRRSAHKRALPPTPRH
ncbi:MAG: NAD(+) synthase [Bacillota bacterium]|nr:NAD(+) synthase [Bacillota bacterium]